jgi:hypothetical protein
MLALGGILLAALVTACTGDVARPNGVEESGTPSGEPRLRRLSARELANSVRDLLGEEVDPKLLPQDLLTTGYDNGALSLEVDGEEAASFEAAAESAARAAVARGWTRFAGGCDRSIEQVSVCRDRMIATLGRRVFRRPVRDSEAQRLRAVFDAASGGVDPAAGAEAAIATMLQSPAFLYRTELGAGAVNGRASLDGWERATALSYFLSGSTPDEPLMSSAERGGVATADRVLFEARRLLELPSARVQLRHFVEEWLALDRLDSVTKDPALYPELDDALRRSMREEMTRFLDAVLDGGRGTLRDLFTSDLAFVDARLARIYGVSHEGDAMSEVRLSPDLRAGVLTRAGYLTVHSGTDGTSPVERGLFTRSAFLCAPMPAPPPGIDRNVPKTTAPTARERFALHDANERCQACHAAIDGAGFGFEQLDPIGRHRPFEGAAKVSAAGVLYDADLADPTFDGVVELEQRLLASPRFRDCFVRHAFRFAMGTGETSADGTTLRLLARDFTVDTPLADLFVAIAASPAFLERWAR